MFGLGMCEPDKSCFDADALIYFLIEHEEIEKDTKALFAKSKDDKDDRDEE